MKRARRRFTYDSGEARLSREQRVIEVECEATNGWNLTTGIGAQVPRIRVVPPGTEHPKWSQVVDFVRELGIQLDPWQWDVLHSALLRAGDFWAAFTIAICCPRQNGKNAILEVRELVGPLILGEKLVIHSAHRADTSMEGFRRLDDLLDENAWLSRQVKNIRRQNGHEQITFRNGCRIRFRTRGGQRGGGRGFSGSPVMFDEAMFLSDESMSAIHPVMSSQPDPQAWYTGSAVDQLFMDEGVVFARIREKAQSESPGRLVYFEWSLDVATPDAVESAVAQDETVWTETNPALGIRITTEYLRAEQRALDLRSFAVERLGVGDWPRTDGLGNMVISPEAWAALADADSKVLDPVVFTFDVAPDRSRSVIAATGRRADDLLHMEIVEHKAGTGWIPSRLLELIGKHETTGVYCDGVGPAASLVHEIGELGIKVVTLDAREYAHACGIFFDAVDQKTLRHLGTPETAAALRGAGTRPLSDAWAWSRKNSSTDITPLVAATIGTWAVLTRPLAELAVAFV